MEAGLVERRADPDDRRGTLVRLTEEGKAAIDAALETHVRNEERLLEGMAADEVEALNELLRRLLASLEGKVEHDGEAGAERGAVADG